MRILHIGNIAGVAVLLVQGLRSKGLKADLIERIPHKYGFPKVTVLRVSNTRFLFHLFKTCWKYDIVHVHGLPYRLIIYLKLLGKKVVVHLHGEIRLCYKKPMARLALRIAERVLVSTPDLIRYCDEAVWLPNPIDPRFKPLNCERHGVLYFRHRYEFLQGYEPEILAKKALAKVTNAEPLTIMDPTFPYENMPELLNSFEYFADRFTIRSLSKTALEALACGCKVISWKGLITKPEEIVKKHSLPVVTEKLIEIYEKILKRERNRWSSFLEG